ncbi:hypothetical protein APHCR_1484 [Anaplasma phagocytophilum str. CR1007]|nr:hypothetical protein APHCR_1466 [Anaplasma phagocytophilum str. CR1007]KKA00865.1 hypothetical protein APHCR_1484 [Anaplasma phagocytophilum str. CR1007]
MITQQQYFQLLSITVGQFSKWVNPFLRTKSPTASPSDTASTHMHILVFHKA